MKVGDVKTDGFFGGGQFGRNHKLNAMEFLELSKLLQA